MAKAAVPFYALSKRHCFFLLLVSYLVWRSYSTLPPLPVVSLPAAHAPPFSAAPGVDTLILRVRSLSSAHSASAASTGALSSAAAPAGLAAAAPPPPPPSEEAAPTALSSPLLPVSELLPLAHPLYPYPSMREFSASLRSGWFTGDMPYYNGPHVCPVSGCRLSLTGRGGDATGADMLLYHMGPRDYTGSGEDIPAPGRGGTQLVALMTAEGFDLASRPASLFARFNAEHSFRASSLVRDSYVLWFLNDAHKQGILSPQRPLRLDARVWEDIWEPPLPLSARSTAAVASWGSHYCRGARSNREDLVRALMAAGLRVAVFGGDSQCLRNVEESLASADRNTQFAAMRTHKFYLAFENHRLEGYVSEKVRRPQRGRSCKESPPPPYPPPAHLHTLPRPPASPQHPSLWQFYWALLRGQVPVVWGAPDIARFAPGAGSYIDASEFPSAEALAQRLLELDADDKAYMAYHAWRTERSFWDYGDILREELLEMIWVGNATMHPPDWYNCRFCHAFERYSAAGGFKKAPQMGIKTFAASQRPAYGAQ